METTTQPTIADADDSSAVTLGLKFKPSVDGFIRGVRYYRDSANTGTHVGKLFGAGGTQLASVTIPTQGTGWQSVNFSSPVSVSADTTYVISYYAPNGHYSASSGYFNDTVVNVPLSSVGAGGVYANGNNFPDNSYLNTNYYVDAIFTTNEDGPPEVSDTAPNNQASGVEVDSTVKAKFDRAVNDDASLEFTLSGPGTTSVDGEVSYNASTRTATFTPDADLTPGVTYEAEVDATSTGGTSMTTPKSWTFTTVAPPPVARQSACFPLGQRRLFRPGMTVIR